jgi:alpha-methylacyl-CoA racemase
MCASSTSAWTAKGVRKSFREVKHYKPAQALAGLNTERKELENMSGPLKGLKVIEFGGIGPGPFCAMMLADMGADVIRLDRKVDKGKDRGEPAFLASGRRSVMHRGRRSVAVDLKAPQDRDKVLAMLDRADALIEGYRPGVMERLGLGPDVLPARNPRLVYGRMTGWGQDGPLAQAAGHDINYIALSGALHAIGRKVGGPVAAA